MNLLAWYSRIPGQEINVRIPSAPNQVKQTTDVVETDPQTQPMTFTWGSSTGSEWNFDVSFDVKQGIDGPIAFDMPTRETDRLKVKPDYGPRITPRRDLRGDIPIGVYPFQPYPVYWLAAHALYVFDLGTKGTEYDYDQPQ